MYAEPHVIRGILFGCSVFLLGGAAVNAALAPTLSSKTETTIYEDDFSAPLLSSDWTEISGSWSINAHEKLWLSASSAGTRQLTLAAVSDDLSSFEVEAEVKLTKDNGNPFVGASWAGFHFRKTSPADSFGASGYLVYLRDNGKVAIHWKTDACGGTTCTKAKQINVDPGVFYNLRVVASGPRIRVYVDGVLHLDEQSTDYAVGYFSFMAYNGGAVFDDFFLSRGENRVWSGPQVTIAGAGTGLRSDYVDIVTNTEDWPDTFARTDVFRLHLRHLAELSDTELETLVEFLEEAELEVAFEVGGVRAKDACAANAESEIVCGCDDPGQYQAQILDQGNNRLGRWIGEWTSNAVVSPHPPVSYLTADNPIEFAFDDFDEICGPSGAPSFKLPEESAIELALYFGFMTEYFEDLGLPVPRFGLIEAEGRFEVPRIGGGTPFPPRPGKGIPDDIDPLPFDELMDLVVGAMEDHVPQLFLDHLHTDFGPHVVAEDAGCSETCSGDCVTWELGRVLSAGEIARARSLNAGNFLHPGKHGRVEFASCYGGQGQSASDVDEYAVEMARRYAEDLEAAGGDPDHVISQASWHFFPAATGPEATEATMFGQADVVLDVFFPLP